MQQTSSTVGGLGTLWSYGICCARQKLRIQEHPITFGRLVAHCLKLKQNISIYVAHFPFVKTDKNGFTQCQHSSTESLLSPYGDTNCSITSGHILGFSFFFYTCFYQLGDSPHVLLIILFGISKVKHRLKPSIKGHICACACFFPLTMTHLYATSLLKHFLIFHHF